MTKDTSKDWLLKAIGMVICERNAGAEEVTISSLSSAQREIILGELYALGFKNRDILCGLSSITVFFPENFK